MRILKNNFVENIPQRLYENELYISIEYDTVVHLCACGCGNEVVTPLSPTDWKLIYDGKKVSLYPSIGNWSFECKSHYFITENQIIWERKYSDQEIFEVKKKDREDKIEYYGEHQSNIQDLIKTESNKKDSWWSKLIRFLFRKN